MLKDFSLVIRVGSTSINWKSPIGKNNPGNIAGIPIIIFHHLILFLLLNYCTIISRVPYNGDHFLKQILMEAEMTVSEYLLQLFEISFSKLCRMLFKLSSSLFAFPFPMNCSLSKL